MRLPVRNHLIALSHAMTPPMAERHILHHSVAGIFRITQPHHFAGRFIHREPHPAVDQFADIHQPGFRSDLPAPYGFNFQTAPHRIDIHRCRFGRKRRQHLRRIPVLAGIRCFPFLMIAAIIDHLSPVDIG